jgi:cyclic pyranopterin phosphate synthase
MSDQLTHMDDKGRASMVDVSLKSIMRRTSIASGYFVAKKETLDAIWQGNLPKGEALAVARVAGIQAAKQCDTLIPLCHTLPLEFIDVSFEREDDTKLKITATARIHSRTGIEMEALTAVSVAALTLWDMAKAIDKELSIEHILLIEKKKESIKS